MAKKAAKKRAAATMAKPSRKLAEAIDRELVQSAIAKRKAGKKPTREEVRALLRFEKAKEEADRWRFYSSIPKRHWATLAGRQHKTLDEQAARYGMPVGGKEIDLAAVARWLHQFLAAHAKRLAALQTSDPLLFGGGESTPAMERYRRAMATLREMDVEERAGQLIPRNIAHDNLMAIAGVLRGLGAQFQRQENWTGAEAHEALEEALDDAEALIERSFALLEGQEAASEKQSDGTDGK